MVAKQVYHLQLRKNGACYGHMGPYANKSAAQADAKVLKNPGVEVLLVPGLPPFSRETRNRKNASFMGHEVKNVPSYSVVLQEKPPGSHWRAMHEVEYGTTSLESALLTAEREANDKASWEQGGWQYRTAVYKSRKTDGEPSARPLKTFRPKKGRSNPSRKRNATPRRKNTHLIVGQIAKFSKRHLDWLAANAGIFGVVTQVPNPRYETVAKAKKARFRIEEVTARSGYGVTDLSGGPYFSISDHQLVAADSTTRKFPGTGYKGETPSRKPNPSRYQPPAAGSKNARYLDGLPASQKRRILKHLADHYGVSVAEIEDEVNDPDAEYLFEYTATDRAMTMEIYNDFKQRGLITNKGHKPKRNPSGAGRKPTYKAARLSVWRAFGDEGWTLSNPHLKVLHATFGKTRLWFKPQAILVDKGGGPWAMGDAHTLAYGLDLRQVTNYPAFVRAVEKQVGLRNNPSKRWSLRKRYPHQWSAENSYTGAIVLGSPAEFRRAAWAKRHGVPKYIVAQAKAR